MKSESTELMLKKPYPSIIKWMKSKSAELMLKKPYPSIIKVDEKQEHRTHAKKSLSKYDKR